MKLGTKGRYAVMALADIAVAGGAHPVPLADVAERQDISLAYLEQLFAKLRRAGLVRSVRGPGGGYVLAHRPDDVRVADIVAAVDETIRATRCHPAGAKGCLPGSARCLTHDLWEELGHQIHLFLASVTLADVVARRVLGAARPAEPGALRAPEALAAQ
ncbi:MAG: Rrf2 family transcriptional regulator [Alphaproteobacteria bacterium]